ncbi:MAG: hypothetical protein AB8H79_24710, partial [Myxococcota bacterium]
MSTMVMPLLRRRRFWILAAVLLTVVIAIAGALIAVRTPMFETWLAGVVVAELDKATHERARVDRAWLTFGPPGLQLDNLVIADDVTGQTIVSVERIQAPVVLRDGGFKLGHLRVLKPEVELHLDERGRLQEFRRPDDGSDAPAPAPLKELPFYGLELVDGRFTLNYPDGSVQINDLQVLPLNGPVSDVLASVDVEWRDFSDHADLDIREIVLGPDRIEVPDLRVELQAAQLRGPLRVDLDGDLDSDLELHSRLQHLSPLLSGPRYLEGNTDTVIRLHGTVKDPAADIRIKAADVAYDAPGKVWPRIRYGVDELAVEATVTPGGVTMTRLVAREELGTVTAVGRAEPIAQPDGSVRWELVGADISGDSLSLAALLRAFS